MTDPFREPLKKKVGGSLSQASPLKRLAMLQRNALMLRGGKWQPPPDDGTLVRKRVPSTDQLDASALRHLEADPSNFD